MIEAPLAPPSPRYVLCSTCEKNYPRDEYETCPACSDVRLCEDCEENYHDRDYDRCYQCHQTNYAGTF